MPAVKQGGGYTLTFSKKNKDVQEHLDNLKKSDKVKITDYLCYAVRFYEENKDNMSNNNIDLSPLEQLIENGFSEISNMIYKISNQSNEINNEKEKLISNAKKVGGFGNKQY